MKRNRFKNLYMLYEMLKLANITDLIYGFLISFILSAFILYGFEPNFNKLGDSLWFCFSSVTTIGYGDIFPISTLGRIITVILSVYGIVLIAVVTGAIANFTSELQKIKSKEKNLNILGKLEHLDYLSKDELKELSQKIRNRNLTMQLLLGVVGVFLLVRLLF